MRKRKRRSEKNSNKERVKCELDFNNIESKPNKIEAGLWLQPNRNEKLISSRSIIIFFCCFHVKSFVIGQPKAKEKSNECKEILHSYA